jgi:hypothetical protein
MSETTWKLRTWFLVSAALFVLGGAALAIGLLLPNAIFPIMFVLVASWALAGAFLVMGFIRALKKAQSHLVERSPSLQRLIGRWRRLTTKTYPSPTPILDLLAPMPKAGQSSFAQGEFALPVFLAFLVVFQRDASLIVPLLCLWPLILLVTAVHELGHVVAGHCLGFTFKSVSVGPVVLRREKTGFRIGLRKALFGGLTYMSVDRFYRVRKRLLLYLVAGPAADFALAVVAIAGLRSSLEGGRSSLPALWGALAGLSVLSSAQSLYPYRSRYLANDGLQMRVLLRSVAGTKQVLAIHALDLQRRKGTDHYFMNQRWATLALSPVEPADSRYSKYREVWNAYWENHNEEKAAAMLESCLAMSAPIGEENRDLLILEAAVFTARVRHDSAKAALWFQRATNPPGLPALARLRAQATLSSEAGRLDDAIAALDQGLDFLRRSPATPSLEGQQAAWTKWRSDIQSRLTHPPVPA